MRYRDLGSSGLKTSVVGLGTWVTGGWQWGGADDEQSIKAIHAALDQGITLIDTAPIYGFGRSEEIVGKAIADRRDKVLLATKCGLIWTKEKGQFHFYSNDHGITKDPSPIKTYKYLHPDSITEELEQSLKRLQTDCIDLYQTHWPDPTTAVEDTMAQLLKLKDQGKIRAIGLSNTTCELLDEHLSIGPVVSVQEKYSMLDRAIEKTLLPKSNDLNIAVFAYSPIAQGLLTGKLTPDRTFPEGDIRNQKERYNVENRKRITNMLNEFTPIAESHNITLAQLAIAWTVAQPGLTCALVGVRTPAQAKENAAAGDVVLSPTELDTIEQVIQQHATSVP
ncbi:MAG: aldo/keto reductase [Planctomycetes bacterium]|nr:aldo/keto reductase [Planctomycetota bacterium]